MVVHGGEAPPAAVVSPTRQLLSQFKDFGGSFGGSFRASQRVAEPGTDAANDEASMTYAANYIPPATVDVTDGAGQGSLAAGARRLSRAASNVGEALKPGNLSKQASNLGEVTAEVLSPANLAKQASNLGEATVEVLSPANLAKQASNVGEALKPDNLVQTASSLGEATAEVLSPSNLSKQASNLGEAVGSIAGDVATRLSMSAPEEEAPVAVLEAPPESMDNDAGSIVSASDAAVADKEEEPPDEPEPPRRPSILEKVGSAIGLVPPPEPEPAAEEPPPPPKPTIEDSPADAQVRAWIKSVLLGSDDLRSLELLNDRTVQGPLVLAEDFKIIRSLIE